MHVRPIRPDDASRLDNLHERLSRETRYLRFFSPMPHLSPDMLSRFVTVDYVDRMALVATLGPEIVGVARYDVVDDRHTEAEVAFTVDDSHQGRGIGTVLLEHLAAVAADRGITRFVADTLPNNTRMLNVFRSAGFGDERRYADGVVRVSFPIEPTAASLELVYERERAAAAASVRRMLQPGSVAVIGAGRERGGVGHEVFRNILRSGFTGPCYPVNRAARSVASVHAYPDLASIPDPVDLAVVAVPAAEVPAVVDECGASGVRGLVILSEGFADAGPEGAAAQRKLVEQARSLGMRVLGPNSMGVANAATAVRLNASLAPELPAPGRVGFMAQSGPLGVAILEEARRRGIGFSTFASAGNKADVSGNDLIQYWDEDPGTDVVLLYLESFGNPRTFARVARRLSRRKAVVAVRAGRSARGRELAGSPWSGPIGSDEVIDALFRHTGVIRVDTLTQLFDVAEVLAHQPLPAGRRVGIVANAGGSGVLVADACEDAGLAVPPLGAATSAALAELLGEAAAVHNPVTVPAGTDPPTYERVLELILADPGVDALIVAFLHPLMPADRVAEALGRLAPTKPVVANLMGARSGAGRVPVFGDPEAAAQALARVVGLAEWRSRPAGELPVYDDADRAAARMIVTTALAERPEGTRLDLATALDLLRCYGIRVAPTEAAGTPDEAMDAAARLGFPVVLKALRSAGTEEAGLVRMGLGTPADVARAWDELAATTGPDLGGAVVQPMVAPGAELIVEVRTDPALGQLLWFGPAGPVAAMYGDRALRVLPVTDVEAEEMVRSVKGAPRDHVAVVRDMILRLSHLTQDVPEVAAVSLGPVLVSTEGATAVDAHVSVAPYQPLPELALRRLR